MVDQTAEIQAIIDAAGTGTALIPAGVYTLAGPLWIGAHQHVRGDNRDSTILNFTGNGGGISQPAEKPPSTGFIRFKGSDWSLSHLTVNAVDPLAGATLINVQDGAETSNFEIDHVTVYGGGPNSTNVGIYMYSVDSFTLSNFLIQYCKNCILVGPHTLARAEFGPGILKTGTDNSQALLTLPPGLNCFSVRVHDVTFELYGSSRAVNCPSANGVVLESLYIGDASPTGGDAIAGNATIIGGYINPATNGRALHGTFDVIGAGIYGNSLLSHGGAFTGCSFYCGPAGGAYVTLNQGAKVVSIRNTFEPGPAYSYCAANSLMPSPIVSRTNDTDLTASGISGSGVSSGP